MYRLNLNIEDALFASVSNAGLKEENGMVMYIQQAKDNEPPYECPLMVSVQQQKKFLIVKATAIYFVLAIKNVEEDKIGTTYTVEWMGHKGKLEIVKC